MAAPALVVPQNWLFLDVVRGASADGPASDASVGSSPRSGTGAFRAICGDVVKRLVLLATVAPTSAPTRRCRSHVDRTLADRRQPRSRRAFESQSLTVAASRPARQIRTRALSPDAVAEAVFWRVRESAAQGSVTGDYPRFDRTFWEVDWIGRLGSACRQRRTTRPFGGREQRRPLGGRQAWRVGRLRRRAAGNMSPTARGTALGASVACSSAQMRSLPATLYTGELFDNNLRGRSRRTRAICRRSGPSAQLGRVQRRTSGASTRSSTVTNAHARQGSLRPRALDRRWPPSSIPNGLPEPHSDDPTQWLFKGNVVGSEAPLQVAVARLLGYRWPDQEPDALDELADADGLVPLVVGRAASARPPSACGRLLARAYGDAWSPALLEPPPRRGRLAGHDARGLAARRLLRPARQAVPQPPLHLARLGRPQGRLQRPLPLPPARPGQAREADLHPARRLDRAPARRRRRARRRGPPLGRPRAPGASSPLILEGEAPYDIYVRWKSLAEQPHRLGARPRRRRPAQHPAVRRPPASCAPRSTSSGTRTAARTPTAPSASTTCHPTLAEKRAARAAAGAG